MSNIKNTKLDIGLLISLLLAAIGVFYAYKSYQIQTVENIEFRLVNIKDIRYWVNKDSNETSINFYIDGSLVNHSSKSVQILPYYTKNLNEVAWSKKGFGIYDINYTKINFPLKLEPDEFKVFKIKTSIPINPKAVSILNEYFGSKSFKISDGLEVLALLGGIDYFGREIQAIIKTDGTFGGYKFKKDRVKTT